MLKWALAVLLCLPLGAQATVVRLQTTLGTIDIALMDSEAPRTVANFLAYVSRGACDNSFVHRSVPGFVIQGGGYVWVDGKGPVPVVTDAPIANEFGASRSNVRGTLAMAKGDNPDSATSQWFVNLADNSANLDNQNGGFTVFGRVTGEGMAVVDAIAALETRNAGGAFTNLPLTSVPPPGGAVTGSELVMVISTTVLPGSGVASDSDRVFNYLEAAFPQFIAPSSQSTGTADIYTYRYYPGTNAYVGTADGKLYYLGPAYKDGTELYLLGSLAEWLATAAAAGY